MNHLYYFLPFYFSDLSKNRFSELPEEVTTFYFLEKLQCYHNAIRYIPDTVSSLQCLNYLDLSRNQLTALPRELCQLPIQVNCDFLLRRNRKKCAVFVLVPVFRFY